MDGPGTSARIILMNVYSTSWGRRWRTAGSLAYGGPGAGAGGEVSIDYIMPEGTRGGCTHQAVRSSTKSKDKPLGMPLQFKVNSSRILLEFYRDSTGQGDTYRPIRRGYLPRYRGTS